MSHFTQLNLQGNSAGKLAENKPAPGGKPGTGNQPAQKPATGKKQMGSAKVATIGGSLVIATVVVLLTLGLRNSSKEKSTIAAPNQASALPATPPVAALPATPATKKSARQHKVATYKNSDYGLSFRYPKHYSLKEGEDANLEWTGMGPVEMNFVQPGGETLTAVELPEKAFPGTDFSSGFFSVSVNPKMTSTECEQFAFPEKSTSADDDASARVKVGGTEFDEVSDSSADATKQADAQYYHIFQNNVCYEFTLGLQTAGDAATKAVNRDAVFDKLKWMLSTVKIKPVETEEAPATVSVGTSGAAPTTTN